MLQRLRWLVHALMGSCRPELQGGALRCPCGRSGLEYSSFPGHEAETYQMDPRTGRSERFKDKGDER